MLKIVFFWQLKDQARCQSTLLDMQARLLLDMLGKGIESALINPSTLLPEPWHASSDMLSNIEPDKMTVDPALLPNIQVYFTSCCFHFIVMELKYNLLSLIVFASMHLVLAEHW
jgi:hypothetical protein